MSLLKDEGPTKEWYIQYPFDRWQRLRRHPDYRSFCRKYQEQFEEIGHCKVMFSMISDDTGDNAPLLEIKEQFNLSTVYHYNCDFSPSELLNISPIFKNDSAVVPQCNHKRIDSKTTGLSLVKDGHYINCRINIAPDIPLREILDMVTSFVKLARFETTQKNKRSHFDNNMVAYQVYDLRVDRVPFKYISKELGIDAASARKKFSRAWELIHEEEYNRVKLSNLTRQHFAELGQWDRFRELDSPRNEVLAYADKDGRLASIDKYRGDPIRVMKALCRGCGDTECSQVMFNIYDELKEEGIPNLGDFEPCPDLIKLLQDLIYPKARKSPTLPGAE